MSGIKSHKKSASRRRPQTAERRQSQTAPRRASAASPRRKAADPRRSSARPQRVKRTIKPSAGYKLRKKLPFIIAAVVLLVLIWGGITAKNAISLRGYDKSKIAKNIKIGPVDVSGMSKKQATKAVKKFVKKSRKSMVTIAVEGESAELSLKDLGLKSAKAGKLADQALAYGNAGSVNKRHRKLKKLETDTYVVPLKMKIDHKRAADAIIKQCETYEEGPVNATLKVSGDKVKVVKGKAGMVVDAKKTIREVEKKLGDDWTGRDIAVKATSVKADPAVTEKDLKGLKDELGSYETSFEGSDAGRANNIANGVEMINGTLVRPGEVFSADGAMRPYTEERGWEPAGSYENGDVVDTMGGGICQISSTLYNAVLYAELEVVERRQHSMRVLYVDPGRDAAIADDVKDFKFKNNTDTPVYIYGHVEDEKVTFAIYGKETRPKDRKIEFESEILSTEEFKTVYKACSENIGYMMITANGHEGMEAKLWKIVTEDGEQKEKEEVNRSEYRTQNTIVSVGVSGSAAASNIVSSALASQDDATIRQAIAKAAAYR